MKLAFVSSHPAPYRDAFLAGLARAKRFRVDIYSLFPQDKGHDFWKLDAPPYENKVIVSRDGMSGFRIFVMLLRQIVFTGYDCVCWPGFSPWYLVGCMLIQAALRRKYIIVADTVEQRKINGLSFAIKRFLIRRATMLFVSGERSREFFATTFNVDKSKICLGAYSLDGNALEERIALYGKERRCLRSQYGIGDGDRVFLMVANMIKTRHYPITSEAFLRATRNRDNIKFIMVGRGPELECMQELATRESALLVLPGVSFDEMLKLYAMSDVYVHGGTEPASTALVIGAIAHLPLISSPAVGCFADVVIDGETGYAVNDYLSVEKWESAFVRALDDMSNWKMMGDRARALSKTLDSDKIVEEFSEKVMLLMGGRCHGE